MNHIIERLKCVQNRTSTRNNYLSVWRKFNEFIIRLDKKPQYWEDRASLFGAYLVDQGYQSTTLRSYMSAIKCILKDDGYTWNDSKLLLSTLVHGCHVENDTVRTRLPIQIGLLELIMFELQRMFGSQYYLEILYKTLFCIAYYGLFRIGELTKSEHCIKAKDVHISDNKDKILLVLRSSKTHGKYDKPQEIVISANENYYDQTNKYVKRAVFCPFQLASHYFELRGGYEEDTDEMFIFKDRQPVLSSHVCKVMRQAITALGLNPMLYNTHSYRAGRAFDLVFKFEKSVEFVKSAGRWKSSTVYKYIKSI